MKAKSDHKQNNSTSGEKRTLAAVAALEHVGKPTMEASPPLAPVAPTAVAPVATTEEAPDYSKGFDETVEVAASDAKEVKLADLVPPAAPNTPVPVPAPKSIPITQLVQQGSLSKIQRHVFRKENPLRARFVTDQVIPVGIHFDVKNPGSQGFGTLFACNAVSPHHACGLCLAQHRAVENYLIPVYSLDHRDFVTILFQLGTGPGSIGVQLATLLQAPDFLGLIFLVHKRDNNRVEVMVERRLVAGQADPNGLDLGTQAIQDARARSAFPTPADILATVERRSNQTLLRDFSWVAERIKASNPPLDLATL